MRSYNFKLGGEENKAFYYKIYAPITQRVFVLSKACKPSCSLQIDLLNNITMNAEERAKFKGMADMRIVKELDNSSPRATVIVAASTLELHLEQLLEGFLIADVKKVEELISSSNTSAPLGNFGSKIKACYLLGLISEELYNDLEIVRKIRNRFAHQLHGCNFTEQSVVDMIKNFYFVNNIFEYSSEERPRSIFMLEIMTLSIALVKKIVRCKKIQKLACEVGGLGWEEEDYKWMMENNPYHPSNPASSSETIESDADEFKFKHNIRVK